MKKKITTKKAPAALGPYSQGVINSKKSTVYISGQIALRPGEAMILAKDFKSQATIVFENLMEVAAAGNCSSDNFVKLTIYLTNLKDFDELNQIMQKNFNAPFPARSTVEVAALPKGALLEIDAILSC